MLASKMREKGGRAEFLELADLKVAKDKLEEAFKRITPAQRMTQEHKLTEIETKRVQQLNKSREEYLKCIETRDDELPITKFGYQLKMLRFTEWLELHELASKKKGSTNDQLLKTLKSKFKWVTNITEKLNIPHPYQLIDYKLPLAERKRNKTKEILHQADLYKSLNNLKLRFYTTMETRTWSSSGYLQVLIDGLNISLSFEYEHVALTIMELSLPMPRYPFEAATMDMRSTSKSCEVLRHLKKII
ncbi:hypothetical protein Tco_1291497 [Tanacetum coccineum]